MMASHSARYFLSRGSFSSPMGVRYSVSSPTASLTIPVPPVSFTSLAKSPTTTTLFGSHSPSPRASSCAGSLSRVPYPVLTRMPTREVKSAGCGPGDERIRVSVSEDVVRREERQTWSQWMARRRGLSGGRMSFKRW